MAVRQVANGFEAVAELIDDAVQHRMAALAFDGATAGRAHADRGDALRAALSRLTGELVQWSRAAGGIAATLRVTADRYADAELGAAARIG